MIQENIRIKEFVLSIDYAPTMLALAGAPIKSHIQGQSNIPLLTGKVENGRKVFMVEYYSYENPMPWLIDTDYKALRTGKYKYIHYYKHEGKDEFYNLIEDPYEISNLAARDEMRMVVKS
ncbi:MAG: DUF4976 domain-containing protein [Saprospiraceae bacterium]|nr:DUF4976 domain-containing protein [Saprospiraceae bacterium]